MQLGRRKLTEDGLQRVEADIIRIKRTKLSSSATSPNNIQLPSSSGTLALTTDIPSSANFVDLTSAQSVTGVKTFSTAPVIGSITNGAGTLTLPTTSGTVALTSQIPSSANFVDLTSAQSVTGVKTFSTAPVIGSITNGAGTLTLPTTSGTVALTSQIPSSANFVDLTSAQSVTGVKTFSTAPVIGSITNGAGTLTLPTTSGTIALTSQIPSSASFVDLSSAQSITGVKAFSAAPIIGSITNGSGTLTLPTTSGTLALTSQIPSSSSFVDLSSAQSITGVKTFSNAPVIGSITNGTASLTLPVSSGTIALTSQIPTNSTYVDLTSSQTISGTKIFTDIFGSNLVGCVFYSNPIGGGGSVSVDTTGASTYNGIFKLPSLTSTCNYTLPSSSTTLIGNNTTDTLTNKTINNPTFGTGTYLNASGQTITVPSASFNDSILPQNGNFVVYNKTIAFSSPTTIASVSGSTLTTSKNHGLLVGDSISFPVISTLTGIVANTTYTLATVPSATTFTLTGITFGGTVGSAFYIIIARASTNQSTAGGLVQFLDPSNGSYPIQFDTSSATGPILLRFPLGSGSTPIVFPSAGGNLLNGSITSTVSGTYTFSSGIIATKAGQTTASSAPFYSNPASTAMASSNNYYFNYLNAPTTTGSSTGTASTLVIAGPPSTAASNNYASQVVAGVTSIPTGTSAAPSLVFGTGNNSTGIYSVAGTSIGASIAGSTVASVASTGMTVTGNVTASNNLVGNVIRPYTGSSFNLVAAPNTDSGTGAFYFTLTPSNAGWATSGEAALQLGDSNHQIYAVNGTGMTINDSNGIAIGSNGTRITKAVQFGSFSTSAVIAAGGSNSSLYTITTTGYSSIPNVQFTVGTPSSGGTQNWDRVICSVNVASSTATSIVVNAVNLGTGSTSGTATVYYQVIG